MGEPFFAMLNRGREKEGETGGGMGQRIFLRPILCLVAVKASEKPLVLQMITEIFFLHKNHFLLLGWYILAENTTDGIETFYLLAFKFCSNLRIDKMKTCMLLWFQNENLC